MKPKALIVDDSRMFRKVLKKVIGEDFEVIAEASDGHEGVDQFEKNKPDLILLDITMPNCDGRECLEKIISKNPGSKVIMISSIDDSGMVDECLKLGAKGYINKNSIDATNPSSVTETISQIQNFYGAGHEAR